MAGLIAGRRARNVGRGNSRDGHSAQDCRQGHYGRGNRQHHELSRGQQLIQARGALRQG